MTSFFSSLYSTTHYRLSQIPDLKVYVQNRKPLASYDRTSLIIKQAKTSDFDRLAESIDKFRDGSRISARIARGDVCVVAYKHGTLASARWAALKPIPAWGGHTVHLAPDEAYTYDSYTLPAFRRQGISSETRIFLITLLDQLGICRTYSDSSLKNIHTQQSWRKRVREGRSRIIGVITVSTLLRRMKCEFSAETPATRPILARLYQVPISTIGIRSIEQFLQEQISLSETS
jgi:hypothetical protein